VNIDRRRLAALAAQQLEERHARLLALDVPQRHVYARDGVVQHRPVAPIAVHHPHLPDLFHARHVAADQEGFQVLLDGGVYGVKALRKGGAAQPVQPGLRGDHFDDDQARPGWLRDDGLYVLDGYGWGHYSSLG
jgi:hypothetical protein